MGWKKVIRKYSYGRMISTCTASEGGWSFIGTSNFSKVLNIKKMWRVVPGNCVWSHIITENICLVKVSPHGLATVPRRNLLCRTYGEV